MATANIVNPDSVKCTLDFTLSLGEWKQIKNTLRAHAYWAEIQIIDEIQDLVNQVEQTFYSNSGSNKSGENE